jgi:hypothetical protein
LGGLAVVGVVGFNGLGDVVEFGACELSEVEFELGEETLDFGDGSCSFAEHLLGLEIGEGDGYGSEIGETQSLADRADGKPLSLAAKCR